MFGDNINPYEEVDDFSYTDEIIYNQYVYGSPIPSPLQPSLDLSAMNQSQVASIQLEASQQEKSRAFGSSPTRGLRFMPSKVNQATALLKPIASKVQSNAPQQLQKQDYSTKSPFRITNDSLPYEARTQPVKKQIPTQARPVQPQLIILEQEEPQQQATNRRQLPLNNDSVYHHYADNDPQSGTSQIQGQRLQQQSMVSSYRFKFKSAIPQMQSQNVVIPQHRLTNAVTVQQPNMNYQRPQAPTQQQSAHTPQLKSIDEIPAKYRPLFNGYSQFNHVQSIVFNEILYSNNSVIISAPTGSGKTCILELSIVRLLLQNEKFNFRVIYMAPLKALCNEKYTDWSKKFKNYNLNCIELTGDSDILDDMKNIQNANIICTTPEKFDIITRRSNDKNALMTSIKLFLIDEIHVLGEDGRGATIEVVVSRMKTYYNQMRFVAVSATIPNINDIAEWLCGSVQQKTASVYKIDEKMRPIPIHKHVLGYPFPNNLNEYIFDMRLSYKIGDVIDTYSNGKPTLVFCATRKSTINGAAILTNERKFYMTNIPNNKELLASYANKVKDVSLKKILVCGVGVHHAGMSSEDRKLIETIFLKGHLRVLFCTSTLAIGVNFPAHLVIIKSTTYYVNQKYVEYSLTQIMQMIGRAGRPQFDTSGTAVIMTANKNKQKYEQVVDGSQSIESKYVVLKEGSEYRATSRLFDQYSWHLNNEIVLRTITTIEMAIKWLKLTYLYIRLKHNPTYYGAKAKLNEQQIDLYLEDLCRTAINALVAIDLVKLDENTSALSPTSNGILMSRYCVCYVTMKSIITSLNNDDMFTIEDLLHIIAESREFEDIKLRTDDKSNLNLLNKSKENQDTKVRYPLSGRIKTIQAKVFVLIQAELGCLQITDFSLVQDSFRIFRFASKIAKCLLEYVLKNYSNKYDLCLNTILLTKCLLCKLWYDSPHILRQFQRIGAATSQSFVDANWTQFEQIEALQPFEIETITNRHPPFGMDVLDIINSLPKFEIWLDDLQYSSMTIANGVNRKRKENEKCNDDNGDNMTLTASIRIKMVNFEDLRDKNGGYLHIFESAQTIEEPETVEASKSGSKKRKKNNKETESGRPSEISATSRKRKSKAAEKPFDDDDDDEPQSQEVVNKKPKKPKTSKKNLEKYEYKSQKPVKYTYTERTNEIDEFSTQDKKVTDYFKYSRPWTEATNTKPNVDFELKTSLNELFEIGLEDDDDDEEDICKILTQSDISSKSPDSRAHVDGAANDEETNDDDVILLNTQQYKGDDQQCPTALVFDINDEIVVVHNDGEHERNAFAEHLRSAYPRLGDTAKPAGPTKNILLDLEEISVTSKSTANKSIEIISDELQTVTDTDILFSCLPSVFETEIVHRIDS